MIENNLIDKIKEKLQYTIDFQYRIMKENTIVTILSDNELEQIEQVKELATKEELFDLIKIYHYELKRLRKDVKEIIENE
jgi:hypothetical protein